jgi:hypothetical protein
MEWTFAACGAICALGAVLLLWESRRYRAEQARARSEFDAVTPRSDP